jgi:hypothetical protein
MNRSVSKAQEIKTALVMLGLALVCFGGAVLASTFVRTEIR